MKTRQATVFYCDYCNKKLLHKGYMERHEKECFANPENQRPCFSCGYQERVEVKYDSGQSDHPEIERYYRATQGFKCTLKVNYLFHQRQGLKTKEVILMLPLFNTKGSRQNSTICLKIVPSTIETFYLFHNEVPRKTQIPSNRTC